MLGGREAGVVLTSVVFVEDGGLGVDYVYGAGGGGDYIVGGGSDGFT